MTAVIPQFELQDRLNLALRRCPMNKQEMAAYLGVTVGTLSTWVNGRHRPSTAVLRVWAEACDVPFEWLVGFGAGERQAQGLADAADRFVDIRADYPGVDEAEVCAVRDSNPEPADYGFAAQPRRARRVNRCDRPAPALLEAA